MKGDKIEKFMALAGQWVAEDLTTGTSEQRKLGAQLLLSEVLEYVIDGLGVIPEVNGQKITEPDDVTYHCEESSKPSPIEMLDGLSDVAYTMYWNAHAFGIPLEEAFDLVCDNNLEKFVKLEGWTKGECALGKEHWDCGLGVVWPSEVASVQALKVNGEFYAVGKDARGKVRKPSSYKAVDLTPLVKAA
jgi:hypothetical protein